MPPEMTIPPLGIVKYIGSINDSTPYSPAIIEQGVIDGSGLKVWIPYSISGGATVTLPVYSVSATVPSSKTSNGESGIVITFSWTQQDDLNGTGAFAATITIDDSAGDNDGVYNAPMLDVEDDSAGELLQQFVYHRNSSAAVGRLDIKALPAILDKMYGVPDNNGDLNTHNFVYLPVYNADTGETWLNNNLGADYANRSHAEYNISKQATSGNDEHAYGSTFQWGRMADGHELVDWSTTPPTAVYTDTDTLANNPDHPDFITTDTDPWDWRVSPKTNLWDGVNSSNNVCPKGYRLPTASELNAERLSWSSNDSVGAFTSPLALSNAGTRNNDDAEFAYYNHGGMYWSSSVSSDQSSFIFFNSSGSNLNADDRARGFSVRCIKD